jgi:hypothetical protein
LKSATSVRGTLAEASCTSKPQPADSLRIGKCFHFGFQFALGGGWFPTIRLNESRVSNADRRGDLDGTDLPSGRSLLLSAGHLRLAETSASDPKLPLATVRFASVVLRFGNKKDDTGDAQQK